MNAFQILGISSQDPNVVKAAYRRLCQINHPDRCSASGATEALKAINVAYAWITKGGRLAPEFSPTLVIFRSTEECEAAAAKAAAAERATAEATEKPAKAPRKSRSPTLQDRIRSLLVNGETVYAFDFPDNTEKTFIGAIRGLKNAKYAGPLGPLNIIKTPGGGYRLA